MNRRARQSRAKALDSAVKVAVVEYVRACRSIARQVHAETMRTLRPHLAFLAQRKDGISKHGQDLDAIGRVAGKAGVKAYDRMAAKVSKNNAKALASMGIRPSDTGTEALIAEIRKRNIALITKAEGDYLDGVRDILSDPATLGLRVEDLADLLQERGDVSESRAELIARDQTTKLNGALNETRQTAAGVTEYVWSTSKDERVRPSHAELEGETFSWSDPPVIDGEALNPGEDIQCRCVAVPVLPE